MPIVISPAASDQTKAGAAEIAGCLRQITGAEFKVTVGDGSQGIILGTKDAFDAPNCFAASPQALLIAPAK